MILLQIQGCPTCFQLLPRKQLKEDEFTTQSSLKTKPLPLSSLSQQSSDISPSHRRLPKPNSESYQKASNFETEFSPKFEHLEPIATAPVSHSLPFLPIPGPSLLKSSIGCLRARPPLTSSPPPPSPSASNPPTQPRRGGRRPRNKEGRTDADGRRND